MALILHQVPSAIWGMEYSDFVSVLDAHNERTGKPSQRPLDDLDRQLIDELRAEEGGQLVN